MTYTTALIFATLLHNQQATINTDSKFAYIERNPVNAPVISVLEKRGLAEILPDGTTVVKPKKIEETFQNPNVIDSEILSSIKQGPGTTSW